MNTRKDMLDLKLCVQQAGKPRECALRRGTRNGNAVTGVPPALQDMETLINRVTCRGNGATFPRFKYNSPLSRRAPFPRVKLPLNNRWRVQVVNFIGEERKSSQQFYEWCDARHTLLCLDTAVLQSKHSSDANH